MYLESLTLKNLRRCRDLRMDFTRGGKPRMWTVLIGENGTGKTTILQAIALAAAGNRQAAALAGSCVPHLRDRRNDSRLEIDADFRFGPEGCREPKVHPRLPLGEFEALPEGLGLWSQVRLKKGSSSFSATSFYRTPGGRLWAGEDPLDEAREDKHRHLWFVVGYGVHRVLPSAGRVPDLSNPATNRMRPLFDPDSVPASTSFINYFGGGKKARQYSAALKEVIINTGILPDDLLDLELRGKGGVSRGSDLVERDRFQQKLGEDRVKIPAVALAHGYQSTIAWIADLVGQVLLEAKVAVEPRDYEGLVLVDEIDLYLHPTWQVRLIPALKKTFPKLQFICTTHSPAILGNLAPDEVVRLELDEGGNVVHQNVGWHHDAPNPARASLQPDPRTLTGTELYQEYFGIPGRTLSKYQDKLRSYTALAGSPDRNDYQQEKLERLGRELREEGAELLPEPVARSSE